MHEPGHQREGGPQEADVHRQGLEGWHDGAGLKGGGQLESGEDNWGTLAQQVASGGRNEAVKSRKVQLGQKERGLEERDCMSG